MSKVYKKIVLWFYTLNFKGGLFMTIENKSKEHWMDGLDSYIETLDSAEEGLELEKFKPKSKADYQKKIVQEAQARRLGEWKLRKKQERDKGKEKPKPTTKPMTIGPKQPKPKTHGEKPAAPSGFEYFWSDYVKKSK